MVDTPKYGVDDFIMRGTRRVSFRKTLSYPEEGLDVQFLEPPETINEGELYSVGEVLCMVGDRSFFEDRERFYDLCSENDIHLVSIVSCINTDPKNKPIKYILHNEKVNIYWVGYWGRDVKRIKEMLRRE